MSGKTAYSGGRMPWFKEGASSAAYPALTESTQTDVLVVGGGLSGLMTAYCLTDAGVDCVLVDKRGICSGASRFFAGFSCDGCVSLTKLFSLYRRETALLLWQSLCQAIRRIEDLTAEVMPFCAYKKKDAFLFTCREENIPDIKEEFRLRNFSGFPCEFIGENDALGLFSFPVSGGVYSKNCGGEIDPVAFAGGIAARLTLRGGRIYEESEIVSIVKKGEDTFVSKTKNGPEITSKAVCDCRGEEILRRYPQLGKKKTIFGICSSEAPNLAGWPGRCVMKSDEKKRPLFVFGADSERAALFGEESALVSSEGGFHGVETGFLTEYKYQTLKAEAESMFLGETLTFPFCGSAGFVKTRDGLPYAGEDKALSGYFYVCGGGLNTVPNAVLCGETVAEILCGTGGMKKNLFSFR